MRVTTVPRPYTLIFPSTGNEIPMSQADVDRLLESPDYEVVRATPARVKLRGGGREAVIIPATLGGGPAFEISTGGGA